MEVKDFLRLKDEIEKRKRIRDRDEIRKEGLIQKLVEGFGCKTIPEARKLIEEMEKEEEELMVVFQEKLKLFQESHEGLLGTN